MDLLEKWELIKIICLNFSNFLENNLIDAIPYKCSNNAYLKPITVRGGSFLNAIAEVRCGNSEG